PELLPIGAGGDSRVALEKPAEERDILVAHSVADLLHGAMVAFQQALGGGDAQLLYICERAVAGGVLEAANEVAQAHAHAPGCRLERKVFMKILVQPLLRAGDAVIAMAGL